MKLAGGGNVKFQVMSLEEPENIGTNGLKASLDKSLQKLNGSTVKLACVQMVQLSMLKCTV